MLLVTNPILAIVAREREGERERESVCVCVCEGKQMAKLLLIMNGNCNGEWGKVLIDEYTEPGGGGHGTMLYN
jgi:hypothetical protein